MSRVENKEKYKEYAHNHYIKHKRPKTKIGQAELKIIKLEKDNEELIKRRDDVLLKLAEKTTEITKLEAKLAESKEQVEIVEKQHSELLMTIFNAHKENFELKQQLAEKEKEIEQLNNRILISQLQAPKEQILNILGSQCIQYNPDQDKISFAVEQLEKVKNRIESKVESIYKKLDELNVKIVCESTSRQLDTYEEIAKEIDDQIEELKKGE